MSIRYQRSMVKYSSHLAPRLRLILDAVCMHNIYDILLSEGWHSSNVYTFINVFLVNHDIPRLGVYFNYFIWDSIRFILLICVEIIYNHFFSFAVLMANYALVLLMIILINDVCFCCLIILQLKTWWILNIMSLPKTTCPVLAFSVV